MLRAQVYCSLLFSPPQVKLVKVGSSSSSWLIQYRSAQRLPKEVSVKALKDGAGGETSGFRGQSWDPGSEIEVPFEQRPDGVLYSWGELGPGPFLVRLGGLWLVTFTTLGLPIAAASFNPSRDPLRFALATGTGTLFVVSLIVLRIYLVLARDRLLGSYKVKPVIKLLKQTLVGTGALFVTRVLLFIFATQVEDFTHSHHIRRKTKPIKCFRLKDQLKAHKEELLKLPTDVKANDDLAAAAAAEAADGRPVYCRDRFYRALAGGQY